MKKCKHCKEEFKPYHFNQKYCFKEACKKVWIETEKEKQWRKRKQKLKKEIQTVQDLIAIAQKVFNQYIRLRDEVNGYKCISCGKELRKGNTDAGHYYSAGGHYNVRFHEDNVHAQCSRPCNKDKAGDLLNYTKGLKKRVGEERFLALRDIAQDERKYTREELREIIKEYKLKIKDLNKN